MPGETSRHIEPRATSDENLAEFEGLFVQVVRVAKEAGLVKLGTLAIDGSKIRANASKHKVMSYGRMKDE